MLEKKEDTEKEENTKQTKLRIIGRRNCKQLQRMAKLRIPFPQSDPLNDSHLSITGNLIFMAQLNSGLHSIFKR